MKKKFKDLPKAVLACDFETTTDNPDNVQVWSAEYIAVGSQNAKPNHETNIKDFMNDLEFMANGVYIIAYFHNLKFDGSYILDYMTSHPSKYHPFSYESYDNREHLLDRDGMEYISKMKKGDYTYMISDKNVMYSITLKTSNGYIEFRDSLKLLPFSLRKIAKDFNTPHKKLEMEYGNKQPGYIPSPEEMAYIENDVYVLKEALETVATLSHKDVFNLPMTIGAMAMSEFKDLFTAHYGQGAFDNYFPSQMVHIDNAVESDISTYDDYIRRSYKGGWCYCSPNWQGKVITQQTVIDYLDKEYPDRAKKMRRNLNKCGFVYDVNSLYPSMMHSQSGSVYPIGNGTYHAGDFTDKEKRDIKAGRLYGFIHVQTMFHVKHKHLPCIQIKNDYVYNGREWLESSDYYSKTLKTTVAHTADLYLTVTDWLLIQDQYDLDNTNIISVITYKTMTGIFDDYINKWYSVKSNSKGAMRAWAKLLLNNLYGKFSTSADSSYMFCEYDKCYKKVIKREVYHRDEARAVYIPIGSAITAYARNFTIRHAQENFDIFCYADTDSIHCIGTKDMAKSIVEHPTALCAWKNETSWQSAIFAGQKRYIERVTEEDTKPVDKWYYNVKCCGMGNGAKDNLTRWLHMREKHLKDFKKGLTVPGNLKGHIVSGGTYLEEGDFTFR